MGAIGEARKKRDNLNKYREEAEKYGISLWGLEGSRHWPTFHERLKANPHLAAACKTAKMAKIPVYLESHFKAGTGLVDINVNATDEEIIKFLGA